MDIHRKGEAEIALAAKEIFIKTLDHHHQRHDAHGKQPQKERNDEQHKQDVQLAALHLCIVGKGEIRQNRSSTTPKMGSMVRDVARNSCFNSFPNI